MTDLDTEPDPWDEAPPDWPADVSMPEDRPSWAPVDLSGILSGNWKPPQPAMLTRDDGVSLIYPGLTHSFHGESESGKSWVAQFLTAHLVAHGLPVLYADYESDPGSIVDRLLKLGATRDQIATQLVYVQPQTGPNASGAEAHAWLDLNRRRFALVVIDGVTAAIVASGLESKDNDQVTKWSRQVPEYLAHHTGGAVVMIDHVTKDAQTRGRYAIGAQAKLARITGAAFNLEPKRQLGEGLRGVVAVRVVKDRPGQLRRHAGPVRWDDRSAEIARFVLDSTADGIRAHLEPPTHQDEQDRPFRPTTIMENISKYLETSTGRASKAQIEQNATNGKAGHKRAALELLVSEGYVTQTHGPRGAILHEVAKPYRQSDDPKSDVFTGQPDLSAPDA